MEYSPAKPIKKVKPNYKQHEVTSYFLELPTNTLCTAVFERLNIIPISFSDWLYIK